MNHIYTNYFPYITLKIMLMNLNNKMRALHKSIKMYYLRIKREG